MYPVWALVLPYKVVHGRQSRQKDCSSIARMLAWRLTPMTCLLKSPPPLSSRQYQLSSTVQLSWWVWDLMSTHWLLTALSLFLWMRVSHCISLSLSLSLSLSYLTHELAVLWVSCPSSWSIELASFMCSKWLLYQYLLAGTGSAYGC